MRNKAILFSSLLLVSSSVFAEQGLLKEAAKQAVKDQSAETVKALVKQKIDQATPEQTQKVVELLKAGKEKVENTPKAIKNKAKEKAIGKALDLLR